MKTNSKVKWTPERKGTKVCLSVWSELSQNTRTVQGRDFLNTMMKGLTSSATRNTPGNRRQHRALVVGRLNLASNYILNEKTSLREH